MSAQRGLGRGLSALIPPGDATYRELPLDSIRVNPFQPRQRLDPAALDVLASSIRQVGVLQPILVRETASLGAYELIAGERRWRACRQAGLDRIPAVVRRADNEASLAQAVIENIHRVDLNPLEEAAAYRQLIEDFEMTHEEIGRRMGKSRATITNTLRLLALPAAVQGYLMEGRLTAGHARALLGSSDADMIVQLAERAVRHGWTVRATEQAVHDGAATPPESHATTAAHESSSAVVPDPAGDADDAHAASLAELEAVLSEWLATDVAIRWGAQNGAISIRFADFADLERIYAVLQPNPQV